MEQIQLSTAVSVQFNEATAEGFPLGQMLTLKTICPPTSWTLTFMVYQTPAVKAKGVPLNVIPIPVPGKAPSFCMNKFAGLGSNDMPTVYATVVAPQIPYAITMWASACGDAPATPEAVAGTCRSPWKM